MGLACMRDVVVGNLHIGFASAWLGSSSVFQASQEPEQDFVPAVASWDMVAWVELDLGMAEP